MASASRILLDTTSDGASVVQITGLRAGAVVAVKDGANVRGDRTGPRPSAPPAEPQATATPSYIAP